MQPAATASNRRSATDEERRAAREVAKAEFFHAPLSSHTYRILHVIGEGAYGVVCAAVNEASSERVAIKRIKSVLDSYPVATRILRELKFLRLLRHHENVVTVADVLVPGERDRFNDAFVVSELMPTDLSKLLRSATPLSGDHVKYLMFQLLRAVHFLHSSNVFHRDIKPNNILVNKKCELRVCDFGTSSGERGGGGGGAAWCRGQHMSPSMCGACHVCRRSVQMVARRANRGCLSLPLQVACCPFPPVLRCSVTCADFFSSAALHVLGFLPGVLLFPSFLLGRACPGRL